MLQTGSDSSLGANHEDHPQRCLDAGPGRRRRVLAQAQTPAQAQPAASYHGQSLTRAEVRADLALWKRAGLERFWRGEASPDIYSREYRVAYAEYVRLRSGEYQAEVQRQGGAGR